MTGTVVRLDPGEDALLDVLRRLRDAAAVGDAPSWQALPEAAIDTRSLHHLPPPSVAGAPPPWLVEWRAAYRFGLCHFRCGPGFAVVRDDRAVAGAPRLVVDARGREALESWTAPGPLPRQGEVAEAVAPLVAAALVLVVGNDAMTLPYRLVRWPIPVTAV
ncbi:MAG: DUF5825 family protein [Frankiaceae bacterium]